MKALIINTEKYDLKFKEDLLDIKFGKRKAESSVNSILNSNKRSMDEKLSALIYLRIAVDKVFEDIADKQGLPTREERIAEGNGADEDG